MAWETILPTQQRDGAGTTPGRELTFAKQAEIEVRFPMDVADASNPAYSLIYNIEISNNNLEWREWAPQQTWVGGTFERDGVTPAIPSTAGAIASPGKYWFRLNYNVPVRVKMGLEIQITEK